MVAACSSMLNRAGKGGSQVFISEPRLGKLAQTDRETRECTRARREGGASCSPSAVWKKSEQEEEI